MARLILPFFFLIGVWPIAARAQVIKGVFEAPVPASVVTLYGTTGSQHPPIDSVRIADDGRFAFRERSYPVGFYQLGVNGDDRVDLVIDPMEPVVEVVFHGTPLQRNVTVLGSEENQRLWAYKLKSRTGQASLSMLREQRGNASFRDSALLRDLDLRELAIRRSMVHTLDSLIALAPDGQFAFAVRADRRLDSAAMRGPSAIRTEFDFSDRRLLRSSAYAKAVLLYLQSTPFTSDLALHRAVDTLLVAASRDTACWSYTRWQLLDMFTTYGPDDVAQYLVDRYVVGQDARVPPDRELLILAADQLRMAIGALAPDMILVKPGAVDTLLLSTVWPRHMFTGLFFYSSTCDHCHDQMPGLVDLVAVSAPSHFHLIGIALDATVEEFRATLADERINWPCYSELKAWGAQGAKDYNVKATPSLFVIDREGRIRAKPMDHEELRSFLDRNRK